MKTTASTHQSSPPAVDDALPPRCVVVTGPRGAGKTRWLQDCISSLLEREPSARPAVLQVEEGHTRLEAFAKSNPRLTARKLFAPCTCCPGTVDLPGALRALVESSRADWLFIELPIAATEGLLAEFDRAVRWTRVVVACVTPAWEQGVREQTLPPFLAEVVAHADLRLPSPHQTTIDEVRTLFGKPPTTH